MEFLREHIWIVVFSMVAIQTVVVWLLWPRPLKQAHHMIYMVIFTTMVPLLGTLIISEAFK